MVYDSIIDLVCDGDLNHVSRGWFTLEELKLLAKEKAAAANNGLSKNSHQ